jgi:glyoxylase-like metal-dependent hydrolase (beta-lactamase superfamily II)
MTTDATATHPLRIESASEQGADSGIAGLLPLAPEPLPFAPSLEVRAFLLRRERGNVLMYSTTGLESNAEAIARAGGIARHYLNHRHEAQFASESIRAPLFVHENESRSASRSYHVRAAFSRRHVLDDDFEVIPTPGHTTGATVYLWSGPEHRMLFTGDTIYLDRGEWVAAVLESSDRSAYVESLELIRELDFDLLVPWAATAGGPFYAHTDAADIRRRIDAILARLRRGEDR